MHIEEQDSDLKNKSLFVGTLPRSVSSAQLKALGRRWGRVTQATVFYSEAAQKSQGAGRLSFSSPEEARTAKMAVRDAVVNGKPVPVSW